MTQEKQVVTKADVVTGIRQLGLRNADTIMAHSSLSAFGWVDGGAQTVINGLLEALAPDGTLCLPTLCQRDLARRFELWDIEKSESDVGRITEVFRLMPGVIRSDHPTHSVAAYGPSAREITAGHTNASGRPSPWKSSAFGYGSPWEWFYQHDILYCFLGVTFRVNTMRHYCQGRFVQEVIDAAPDPVAAKEGVQDWEHPGVWPHYDGEKMQARLDARGLVAKSQIGNATCYAIRTHVMVETICEILHTEPENWADEAFMDWYRSNTR